MKRDPAGKKAETHERIVRAAARAIRKRGYAGVSVADVMKDAGLTHGGFYAHFASREAMLEEALDHAAAESLANLNRATAKAAPGDALEAFVASYLSDSHLEHPESGCTTAALGSETRLQPPEVRKVATRRVKEMADLVARQLPRWGASEAHGDALAVMSTLVGALVIARLVDEPALSAAIREAAAGFIRTGLAAPRPA
jgi:TetR/AcrR family transcriptional repressor of nem operon